MIFSPLIRYALLALAFAAAVFFIWSFLEKRCNTACRDVTAAWEKDKAERIARTTEITNTLYERIAAAQEAARKERKESDAAFAALSLKTKIVPQGTRVVLPAPVARVLDAAGAAGNSAFGAAADGRGQATSSAIPESAATVEYDGREVAQYFEDAPRAYDDAVRKWKAARAREDALREVLGLGANRD